jgi:cytochrome c-type biogenesis protein CcmE
VTIDDEESPDAAAPDDLAIRPVLRSGPPRQHRSKKRLYLAGAVVVVAIGFLIYKGVTSAFVYFKTADQAIADRSALGNSTFDIEGTVVAGTVHRGSGPASTFAIYSNKTTVTVDNSAVPPDLFQAGVPVVLVGHFIGSSNTFASEQILVKHSNQYKAEYPSRVRSNSGVIH